MTADSIFVNGKVYTLDPDRPWAEAVAIKGNLIAAVGTTAEVRALSGPETSIVDLRGRLVLPGFIDSHVHFINGGLSLLGLRLRDAASRKEFAARIAAKAKEIPKGEWILNGDWDHQRFQPVELPRKEWIDAVTPDHPVCVNRLDGHMVLCNSLALKLAGITAQTRTPEGGEIVHDPATGEPTGILKDAAIDLVLAKVPETTPAQARRAAEAALREAAEKGVTSVHDVSGEAGLSVYQDLLREEKLTVRIAFYLPITGIEHVLWTGLRPGFGDDLLHFAGLKGFSDGSLGSATAAFFEPYADDPATSGLLHEQMLPSGSMPLSITAAEKGGIQVALHAIGDRANALILDMFEKNSAGAPSRDRRFRVEHAQHLRPADVARFAKLGIIASVQPYHAIDDGRWAETKIGPRRAKTTYAFRSLFDAGVSLAFGSDWPVAPMDPLMGIYAAVTRATLDGRHPDGWVPEQRIGLAEAVKASTLGGAFAEFAESRKGSIRAGRLADLVVLDRDLFAIEASAIKDVRVDMTVCDGQIVFRR